MAHEQNLTPDSAIEAQMLTWSRCLNGDENGPADQTLADFATEFGAEPAMLTAASLKSLTIGLIDGNRFNQECLMKALDGLHPRLAIFPFLSVRECVGEARADLDLIIYHSHESESPDTAIVQTVTAICQAFPATPLIVLSDAKEAQQPTTMHSTLKSGARGFIPTRTAGLPITFAAIRFVRAGGTFAPLDLLLTNRPDRAPARNRLTSRQMAVLSHLQQGKANKIIAYELGMSESTVKVHVRNIMRKVGATNRTQAAYNAQKLSGDMDFAKMMDG